MKNLILVLSALFYSSAFSNTLAIVDSGVDFDHQALATQMWNNPGEIPGNRRDDDDNFFRDDIYGWNFASDDKHIIDPKYFGTFSKDPHRVVNIQAELLLNGFSSKAMSCFCKAKEDLPPICQDVDYGEIFKKTKIQKTDLSWLCDIRSNKDFQKELGIFGNFAHGTHVANIASRQAPGSKVMGLKLIPTEVGLSSMGFNLPTGLADPDKEIKPLKKWQRKILDQMIKGLVGVQMGSMAPIFDYMKEQKVSVMNGSFGTPFYAIKTFTDIGFRIVSFRKPTKEESDEWAKVFFKHHVDGIEALVAKSPEILFVFAAGNDGTNNDVIPTSPTNASSKNVISVAATLDRVAIAGFSNYGKVEVDLAAPGVAIEAAIPSVSHSETLRFSGTSQASPFVAGVAARMRLINPSLTPEQVKKALIQTVDKKNFLDGKLVSGGIINENRAVKFATIVKNVGFDKAVAFVNKNIADVLPKHIITRFEKEKPVNVMPDLTQSPEVMSKMFSVLAQFQAQM